MKLFIFVSILAVSVFAAGDTSQPWAAPKSPVIAQADGFVVIPNAAVPPEKSHIYRAIFDANQGAEKPTQILPALNMAGSELNALSVSGVPLKNAKFVVVFHGPAINGILNDTDYKAKFGVSNPNLPVLEQFKKAGVQLFVCGQNVAFEKIDPAKLSSTVTIASDALIVLITYQNNGYALLSF
jgi:intracellular sulfur oxidation DsrE/DsrF family protein